MRFVKIFPPGTFCFHEAVLDMISHHYPKMKNEEAMRFVEVGCGAGDLSKILLKKGYKGVCVDFSKNAIAIASKNLKGFIDAGSCKLLEGDIMQAENLVQYNEAFDLAFSMMVMEHVEDDVQFVRNLTKLTLPGGRVMIAVPGRMSCWGIEDDTVGHLRRYENYELQRVLENAGLKKVVVWSIAVPIANMLFGLGNFLVKNSPEINKVDSTQREQTELSGVREIPFKTVFPSCFRLVLNRFTLYPLFILQKLFYRTNLGLTMLAVGRVEVKEVK